MLNTIINISLCIYYAETNWFPFVEREPVLQMPVILMTWWHRNAYRIIGPSWGEWSKLPHKETQMLGFDSFFVVILNKLVN